MANPEILSPLDPTGLLLGKNEYGDLTLPKRDDVYKQGTVLGAAGAPASAAIPGRYVVPIDIDASEKEQPARVVIWGKVRSSRLIFEGDATVDTVVGTTDLTQREHLRAVGIRAIDTASVFHHEDNK